MLSSYGRGCIVFLLFMFLNFSVTSLYIDVSALADPTELAEEEEVEIEESETELEAHQFSIVFDNHATDTVLTNPKGNIRITLEFHSEVTTPPPELS